MLHLAYLMPLLPLAGFVVLAVFGRRLGDPLAGWLGTATIAGSFVIACLVTAGLLDRPSGAAREVTQNLFTWIPSAGSRSTPPS
jgi:NADH-quinone oxidoreductase subunit L